MNLEERVQISILSKYYGKMLTDRQQSILEMYVDNNLSLAEVSAELGISRQAVKDALDNSMSALKNIEEKLNFISRDDNIKKLIEENKKIQKDFKTQGEYFNACACDALSRDFCKKGVKLPITPIPRENIKTDFYLNQHRGIFVGIFDLLGDNSCKSRDVTE